MSWAELLCFVAVVGGVGVGVVSVAVAVIAVAAVAVAVAVAAYVLLHFGSHGLLMNGKVC